MDQQRTMMYQTSKGEVAMAEAHKHWEFDSECPHCGKVNHVSAPVGEYVVRVTCRHCTHGYEYTHVVKEHIVVIDSDEQ
jgi:transcription elongation factor Elf1